MVWSLVSWGLVMGGSGTRSMRVGGGWPTLGSSVGVGGWWGVAEELGAGGGYGELASDRFVVAEEFGELIIAVGGGRGWCGFRLGAGGFGGFGGAFALHRRAVWFGRGRLVGVGGRYHTVDEVLGDQRPREHVGE